MNKIEKLKEAIKNKDIEKISKLFEQFYIESNKIDKLLLKELFDFQSGIENFVFLKELISPFTLKESNEEEFKKAKKAYFKALEYINILKSYNKDSYTFNIENFKKLLKKRLEEIKESITDNFEDLDNDFIDSKNVIEEMYNNLIKEIKNLFLE